MLQKNKYKSYGLGQKKTTNFLGNMYYSIGSKENKR